MRKKLFFTIFLLIASACATSAKTAAPGAQIETQTLAKGINSWDGQKLPAYPAGAPEVTILKIKIPPHTELPLHHHPCINAGVVLSGALTVITEQEEVLQLKAGDALIEVVNKWHYGINEGDVPVELIVFYAGIESAAITVKADSENKD